MTRRRAVRRLAAPTLGLVAALALALAGCGAATTRSSPSTGVAGETTRGPAATATVAAVVHPEIGFRDRRHLATHYRKHGGEFGQVTLDEYLHLAQQLRDAAAGGAILEASRADGVVTRFDTHDGAFLAFDRNLVIRTFFRPNGGRAYFERQAGR